MPELSNLSTGRILMEGVVGRDYDLVHSGGSDADIKANHVGRPLTNDYFFWLFTAPETKANKALQKARKDFYNTYKDQIAELSTRPTKAQLEALGKSLQAEQAKVAEAEKALEEAKKQGGISPEDSAAIKETLSITKWIKEKLGGIFK